MTYIVICLKGLEEITEKEVNGKRILPGRIEFKGKIKEFRSVYKVYELFKKFKFKNQDEILENFKKLKIKIKKKFKIECKREGNHEFKSVDIEKLLGISLQKKAHELNFKEPQTIIFVDIIDDNCFIGLLEKDDLQKRDYRVKLNPDTLNPCIAYAALQLAKYKKGDILVDPICRDGIILIEAGLMKKGRIYGFDKNTRNARINSKIAKVEINLSQSDVDWLDTEFKKNSIKVVSYLPSISKRNNEFEIKKLYSELFHQFEYIVKDYIVLILKKSDLIKEYLSKFKIVKELVVNIGAEQYSLLVLKRR